MTAMMITPTASDTFSCTLGIDGADAAVVVDLNQWPTLAALSSALSGLATQANNATARHRGTGLSAVRDRSERTARDLGPWDGRAWQSSSANMRFFPCRTGWSSANVQAAEKQGPAIGPVGAAIIVNADAAGYAAAISTAVAGALASLTGRLP